MDNPETSDEVKAVLADNTITFAEYEASVLAAVACIEGSGANVLDGDPHLNNRGLYTIGPSWPVGRPELQDEVLGCIDRHIGLLDLFWKELVSPSQQDIAEGMSYMAGCMEDAGLGEYIPPSRAFSDFKKVPRELAIDAQKLAAYVHCARTTEDTYGLFGFAPYSLD